VFAFIAGLNFWAFYRIRKLQKYLLYIVLPNFVAGIMFALYLTAISGNDLRFDNSTAAKPEIVYNNGQPQLQSQFVRQQIVGVLYAYLAIIMIGADLQAFAIYLIIIWSRPHIRQFDAVT
jgi:hypothetical protein